jgi:hypothetical protein
LSSCDVPRSTNTMSPFVCLGELGKLVMVYIVFHLMRVNEKISIESDSIDFSIGFFDILTFMNDRVGVSGAILSPRPGPDYLPARFEKSSSEIHALGYSFFAAATASSYCCFMFLGICP